MSAPSTEDTIAVLEDELDRESSARAAAEAEVARLRAVLARLTAAEDSAR